MRRASSWQCVSLFCWQADADGHSALLSSFEDETLLSSLGRQTRTARARRASSSQCSSCFFFSQLSSVFFWQQDADGAGEARILSEAEATLFALGIRADTGALSFAGTTTRDGHALVWLMERGVSQNAIAE